MALMLDDIRAVFARKLAEDPSARFSMDKALAHVVTLAYEAGLRDAATQCLVGDYDYKGALQCNEEIIAKLGTRKAAS